MFSCSFVQSFRSIIMDRRFISLGFAFFLLALGLVPHGCCLGISRRLLQLQHLFVLFRQNSGQGLSLFWSFLFLFQEYCRLWQLSDYTLWARSQSVILPSLVHFLARVMRFQLWIWSKMRAGNLSQGCHLLPELTGSGSWEKILSHSKHLGRDWVGLKIKDS